MVELVAIVAIGYVVWFAMQSRFDAVLAIAIQLLLFLVGLVVYASRGELPWWPPVLFGFAIASFLFGSYMCKRIFLTERSPRTENFGVPDLVVWSVVTFAGSLAVYHLIAGGIPLLSSSIERQRFDFTSSGLFGVPGRMFLFGVQISWAFAGANATAKGLRWRNYTPSLTATTILVSTTLLSGFKGAIASTAILSACLYVMITRSDIRLKEVALRYWWAAVPAGIYFFGVATLYGTYKTNQNPLWVQLFERATTVGAEPAKLIIGGEFERDNYTLLSDLGYFLAKYTGLDTFSMVPFERVVSAEIIGVDPFSSAWAPPVTITGFVEAYYWFGAVLALLLIALAGFALAWITRSSIRSAPGMFARIVALLAIYNWLIKGGLAYYLINPVAVGGMLGIVAVVAWIIAGGRTEGRRQRLPALARGG